MKIYVGNLSYDATEEKLRHAFESYGKITEVNVIMDRDTGRPRGFAFIEMSSQSEAAAAINGLNGQDLDGRTLKVSEARERQTGDGGGRGRY
jgi:RNA recognition motif-containing protein